MKKTSKIFGAVALSAALAMGTALPAFADTTNEYSAGSVANYENLNREQVVNGGASTNVNIATYSSNYNLIVPLNAPFLLDTNGGDGMAPNNYYITNLGNANVYVTKIDWQIGSTYTNDWTFGTLDTDGTWAGQTTAMAANKLNDGSTEAAYGSFVIQLSPVNFVKNGTTTVATAVETEAQDSSNTDKGSAANPNWVLVAKGQSDGTIAGAQGISVVDGKNVNASGQNRINLAVKGSVLKKSVSETQNGVASIMYTVSSKAPTA